MREREERIQKKKKKSELLQQITSFKALQFFLRNKCVSRDLKPKTKQNKTKSNLIYFLYGYKFMKTI